MTINDIWLEYQRDVLPVDASAVQLQETRRAFYAGFFCSLMTVSQIAGQSTTEDEGIAKVEALRLEAIEFKEQVIAGLA